MDDEKAAQAVKALFATGFFRDVRIENDNGILVVAVQERPTISRVEFIGNKEFDTDTLKKALRDIGLAEARIFDRAALDRAEQEMKRQYISRGLYSAKVTTTATPQDRNRVAVNFTIEEGEPAKIARINIVGTKVYTEAELRSEMLLTTPGWLTWYTKNDQYSKQKLAADLEALRSFYQNRGYLEFNVESTQVSITAGQGGHLHHAEHQRGAALHDLRRPARRRPPGGLDRARGTDIRALRRRLFARAAAGVGEGDERASRRRRVRLRQRQRGARARPGEAAGGVHVLCRSGPPGLRAPDQHQRQRAHPRRGDPPRDAPARVRVVRRRTHRAVEGARAAPRLLRQRQHRNPARFRARPTSSTSRSR